MTRISLSKRAFTLVEIMIVIAIIGIIIAVAVPAFLRAREVGRARACQENLAKIDGAIDQYAMEFKKHAGDTLSFPDDIVKPTGTGYLRMVPACPASGTYDATLVVNTAPACSIGANAAAPFAPHILDSIVPTP